MTKDQQENRLTSGESPESDQLTNIACAAVANGQRRWNRNDSSEYL